jgi:hypothetical protein
MQLDRRLSKLEQRRPARSHPCEIVKVRPDGSWEVINTFWTNHPVTRILVIYGQRKTGGDR